MRAPPEMQTAPRLASESGIGLVCSRHNEPTPSYAESLGVRRIVRQFGISVELATVVAELAGIGGAA